MPLHQLTARPLIGALSTITAVAALAATADAATVARSGGEVVVTAASREANVVTATVSGTDLVITDTGAPLTDGDGAGGCTVTRTTATCARSGVTALRVVARDLDDQVTGAPEIPLVVEAGGGNDVVFGTPQADAVDGGAGDDALRGGAGADNLRGSDGDDELHGGVGADRLAGGIGTDTVTYAGATEGKTADLDGRADDGSAEDGPANARDAIATDVERLVGGAGADALTGADGPNRLTGGPANDYLYGGGGDDELLGEAGNDFLFGYGGADRMVGGDGTDRVRYDERTEGVMVTLDNGYPDDGSDLDGPMEARDEVVTVENVTTGSGGDTIIGNAARNVLSSGDGDDGISGGHGPDELNGGPGRDMVDYQDHLRPISVSLDGQVDDGGAEDGPEGARDVLRDFELVQGGSGDDALSGDAANNLLNGGPGNDVIEGQGGDDLEYGGAGRDVFFQGWTANGEDRLDGGEGTEDVIHYGARSAPLLVQFQNSWGSGEDTDRNGFSDEQDSLFGMEVALGGSGPDRMVGDAAADSFFGGDGVDQLDGRGGDDGLYAGNGSDVVQGGEGADTIESGYGADDQSGGPGDDRFLSTSCAVTCGDYSDRGDLVRGEDGTDTLDFQNRVVGVRVDVGGNDMGEDGDFNGDAEEDDRYETVEHVHATNQRDWIRTTPGDDLIEGYGGDDVVDGGDGNDWVRGGIGNDRVDGGNGVDVVSGGAGDDLLFQPWAPDGADDLRGDEGNDRVSYLARSQRVYVRVDDAPNDGTDGEGDNVHTDVEEVVGGSGNDAFEGLGRNDRFWGYGGRDTMFGGGGDDLLVGEHGDDTIQGGTEQDRIEGGDGNDYLLGEDGWDDVYGGAGDDQLDGGTGNDALRGELGADSFREGNVANGGDQIICGTGGEAGGSGPAGDRVNYYGAGGIYDGRTVSVTVKLDGVANDGEDPNLDKVAEEGDNVMPDCESVWGGKAGDFFEGTAAADNFVGMEGNDGFRSNGGADWLEGRQGDDVFLVRDGQKQTVDGGEGSGDVAQADVGLDVLWNVP